MMYKMFLVLCVGSVSELGQKQNCSLITCISLSTVFLSLFHPAADLKFDAFIFSSAVGVRESGWPLAAK